MGGNIRGRLAEIVAALWLRLRGYRVLAQRYRTHVGEIDLIVQRGRTLVFVEVKARASAAMAVEALLPPQRRRIERAARQFLASRPQLADTDVRFDVVAFGRFGLPRHVPDAWRPDALDGSG